MSLELSKQQIISCYDNLARSGRFPDDTYLHRTFQGIIDSQIESTKPSDILDAGGGAGFFGLNLASPECRITILDLSLEALKTAQKRSNKVALIAGDVENLPFLNSTFDTIICIFVFSHLNDPVSAVREFKRVLRHSGQLILSFENRYWHVIAKGLVERYSEAISLLSASVPIVKAYGILPPVRLYTVSEIEKLLSDQDLQITSFKGVRHLTSFQEHLKGVGTTDAERLMYSDPNALELEKRLTDSGEFLCLARHFLVCCEKKT
jgi:ubiquinone/menaquinone biosynthesis C-methylase UbiE